MVRRAGLPLFAAILLHHSPRRVGHMLSPICFADLVEHAGIDIQEGTAMAAQRFLQFFILLLRLRQLVPQRTKRGVIQTQRELR